MACVWQRECSNVICAAPGAMPKRSLSVLPACGNVPRQAPFLLETSGERGTSLTVAPAKPTDLGGGMTQKKNRRRFSGFSGCGAGGPAAGGSTGTIRAWDASAELDAVVR